MAVDCDGQRAVGRKQSGVGDGVAEFLHQSLGVIERVDIRVVIVQRVRIAAVRLDGQRTVFACHHGARAAVVHHRGGAAARRGGRDRGHRHVGHHVVGVAVGGAIRFDVANRGCASVLSHRVGIGRGYRWVVHWCHLDGGGYSVGQQLAIGGGVAVGVPDPPRHHTVCVARVFAGVAVRDSRQGRGHVADVGGSAAQSECAGGRVVALRPASGQRAAGYRQHVINLAAADDLRSDAHHLRVVQIGQCPAQGL